MPLADKKRKFLLCQFVPVNGSVMCCSRQTVQPKMSFFSWYEQATTTDDDAFGMFSQNTDDFVTDFVKGVAGFDADQKIIVLIAVKFHLFRIGEFLVVWCDIAQHPIIGASTFTGDGTAPDTNCRRFVSFRNIFPC
jgi:hypothetical protein